MARINRPIHIRPPRVPGHPPLTTRSGRLVIYVVCSAGAGGDKVSISGYFSVPPGMSKGGMRAGYRGWLARKLAEGGSDTNRYPDLARWRCRVAPSLGDLPSGSAAVEL